MLFAATLFFILRRKSTTVQSSWRNCMFQDLQTYNGDTPKGKCTSSWYGKNGDGFPTNLRFRNPFQICSFLLLQPRHMIYHIWMCMHYEPKTTLSEDWLLASYCSFDTLWNASAKARPLPMSQSIKMPCMHQANIWKQKTACACTIRQALLHCTYNSGPIVCFSLLAVCRINEFEAMIKIKFYIGSQGCRIMVRLCDPHLTNW